MGGYWDWAITQMTDASSTDVVVYIREKKIHTLGRKNAFY